MLIIILIRQPEAEVEGEVEGEGEAEPAGEVEDTVSVHWLISIDSVSPADVLLNPCCLVFFRVCPPLFKFLIGASKLDEKNWRN